MSQNERNALPEVVGPRFARRLIARPAIALALVSAVLLSALGISSTMVGAVTTDSSRVAGNSFVAAARVDVGPYGLAAVPSNGSMFGPGPDSGVVRFSMQPEGASPIAAERGEEFALEILLPLGVQPGTLPADESGNGFRRAWSTQEENGQWVVRSVVTAETAGALTLPSGTFDIVTEFPGVLSDEAATLHAEIKLPERLMSTHPKDSVVLPVAWNVTAGVYGLGLSGSTATNAAVKVSSHPDLGGETLHLRAGDAIVTTVSVPSSVTPGRLPEATSQAGLTTTWSSVRTGAGWDVTLTETITAPIANVPTRTAQFPVSVNQQAWTSGFTMSAQTVLPARFTSSQARTETKVPGRIAKPGLGKVSAGGGQSMALTNKWLAYGWGVNASGQVGNGTTTNVLTPTWLGYPGSQDFIQVSAGGNHTVALSSDLKVYGWGARQWSLAGGSQVDKPVQVSSSNSGAFTQVSAGYNHSLALGPNGRAWGWGSASNGELGGSSSFTWPTQLQNPAGVQFVQVEAGASTTFGLGSDGTVWGMGSNAGGRLGLGPNVSKMSKFTQIPMPDDARIVQLVSNSSTTDSHTLALTDPGEVIAWGANSSGQGGTASDGSIPAALSTPTLIQLPEGVRFTRLAAGGGVSLGLSYDGSVYSWGGRTLGYAASGKVAVPHQIPSLTAKGGYVDIAAGDQHAFASSSDGNLYGWGSGQGGRLGNNSTAFQTVPVLVPQTLSREADAAEETAPTDTAAEAGVEAEVGDAGWEAPEGTADTGAEFPDEEIGDPDTDEDGSPVSQLPAQIDPASIGHGGVKPDTIVLAAENERYTVWTARDQSEAICVIALVLPDGASNSYCARPDVFEASGVSGSMDSGTAASSEDSMQTLQTYLLPDAVEAEKAAKMIPGSKNYGQLLVRFGDFRQEESHLIELPSGDRTVEMLVLSGS
ncbi:alpha-tubulin suppressor-like RCC1 family protein [Leucobacter komagatae]|uniref:Alpha-tubulin suppressor-like RCC1 family protein n=1 Tax=Leucobacter komagatae TaxID=55969 RepID=A0A542Y5P6_9MICO|nr:hypothetical protein [Leucobacter komagatae]TQL43373.1 alpha-tubulin suppressor-like RCC1 family protein [Leucobacter komagatae]